MLFQACTITQLPLPEAAYIIGGGNSYDIIAEYKDNAWRQLGTLTKGRYIHRSISLGDETMIIGGYSNDGRLVCY